MTRWSFTTRWIVFVAVGEAAGFAGATGAATTAIVLQLDDIARLGLVVPGGALEGSALAIGQYLAMTHNRPHAGRWIGATAAAASIAWALGMLPSTIGLRIQSAGTVVLVVIGALALVATIPVAQWVVLWRPRTFRWVPVNMGAWLVAVLWTAAPSPLVDEQTPLAGIVGLYFVAGLLMAVTIAALTARTARALFGVAQPAEGTSS